MRLPDRGFILERMTSEVADIEPAHDPNSTGSLCEMDSLVGGVNEFHQRLSNLKGELAAPEFWYPYTSLGNVQHLDALLTPGYRDLSELALGAPVADIGAADGDLAFFLAERGMTVDIVDWSPTNWNHLEGARLLHSRFEELTSVTEVDLDAQFAMPRDHYGLILALGLLYHLRNPFYFLQHLAEVGDHVFLSTRIAATAPDGAPLSDYPLAYLVGPEEMNGDPTNFWVFTEAGLKRLFERTGWTIVSFMSVGRTEGDSEVTRSDRDERAFVHAVSRRLD
jgi:tRNA (mo5U34)-methyltransferase